MAGAVFALRRRGDSRHVLREMSRGLKPRTSSAPMLRIIGAIQSSGPSA